MSGLSDHHRSVSQHVPAIKELLSSHQDLGYRGYPRNRNIDSSGPAGIRMDLSRHVVEFTTGFDIISHRSPVFRVFHVRRDQGH